jgi:Fur family peroxide stress response transcriptional regulator
MTHSRLTKQRALVLNVVHSACYHPTAEQIHQLALKTMPNLSVGTVYRNLDVLHTQKRIKRIDIPGEPSRYDADPAHKAYFVCRDKGAIYDLELDTESLSKLLKDHPAIEKIEDFSLVVFGTAKENQAERKMRKGQLKS